MPAGPQIPKEQEREVSRRSLRVLPWLFFFLADVQTGVGPFLAAYLAGNHWDERAVGVALTIAGLTGVLLSPAAGAWVDASRRKRSLVAGATGTIALAAVVITCSTRAVAIDSAQVLIGAAGALLPPVTAAITLGMVGRGGFDRQFGLNQCFNSAGNIFATALLAAVSWCLGLRWIFLATAALAIPVWLCLRRIDPAAIDDAAARAAGDGGGEQVGGWERLCRLCADRTLVTFFACAFLFHLANAAMLPQLGEMLAKGNPRAAAPLMSACIVTTQLVIACSAAWIGQASSAWGRKPLLLAGFSALPVRGVLYTLTHATAALIAIQLLDGMANAVFAVLSVLVVADRMRGTGHFNFAQGALATCVGLGASLSTTLGGMLIHASGYKASFLGLAAIAAAAALLLLFGVPETLRDESPADLHLSI